MIATNTMAAAGCRRDIPAQFQIEDLACGFGFALPVGDGEGGIGGQFEVHRFEERHSLGDSPIDFRTFHGSSSRHPRCSVNALLLV